MIKCLNSHGADPNFTFWRDKEDVEEGKERRGGKRR